MEMLVSLTYAATFIVVILYVKQVNFTYLYFEDGILIGLIFFIIAPISLALFTGEITTDMKTGPLNVRDAPLTAIHISLGCLVLTFFHAFCRTYLPRPKIVRFTKHSTPTISWMIFLYLALTIFMFIKTGKASGGHWHENNTNALSNSFSAILFGNFVNVYRAAIFGLLYSFSVGNILSSKKIVLIAIAIGLCDLVLTFNRITIVYLIIMLFLLYRRHIVLLLAAFAASFSTIAYLSTAWTAMRGIALADGFSLRGLIDAFNIVNAAIKNGEIQIASQTAAVFESANVIVFDWIVHNAGSDKLPLDWGETFIVRPLTVFFPSFLWSGKPASFGLSVGSEIQNVKGLVLNSTLFGEAYGNFGILWPFPLFLALVILAFIFNSLGTRWPPANGMAFFVAFALWRFDISFGVISLVALLFAMTTVNFASRIKLYPNKET